MASDGWERDAAGEPRSDLGKSEFVDIVADVRERPSATLAVLASRRDVALTVATLEFGDASVAARLSFERDPAR